MTRCSANEEKLSQIETRDERNAGDEELRAAPRGSITATGKDVVAIAGCDTGSDCVGTSTR